MLTLKRSLLVFAGFSLVCGLIYPLLITGIAQLVFPGPSNASIIKKGERIIGSQLIGQSFTSARYFHGRPSAIDPPYDASNSGASNLAPTNAQLIGLAQSRGAQVRKENALPADKPLPADVLLTSASGLDPHISPAAALLQIGRVARERNLPEADIKDMVGRCSERPWLGFWGKDRVNVLSLNLLLDERSSQR